MKSHPNKNLQSTPIPPRGARRFGAIILLSLLVSSFLFLPLFSERADYLGRTIREIQFIGLRNVNVTDLYALLSLQAGDSLTEEALNEDIQALFTTAHFSNIIFRAQLHEDDTITIFLEVKELPKVKEVLFEGVDKLYSTDLQGALPFKQGDVYSPQKTKEGILLLKDKYKKEGYFLAEIQYKTGSIDPNNTISITYIVDEGEDIPISKINLLGIRHLDPAEVLDLLEHKEEGALENGSFRESIFEEDKFKILALAKSRGFLDADFDDDYTGYDIRPRNARKPEEGRVVVITYKIKEGQLRHFGGYSIEHDPRAINQESNPPGRDVAPDKLTPVIDPKIIIDFLEFTPDNLGNVLDESKYFRDRQTLQELYRQRGYVFAQIQPRFVNYRLDEETLNKYQACLELADPKTDTERQCKQEANWLPLATARAYLQNTPAVAGQTLRHIHFTIREYGLSYIENIFIKGMVKTQERIIRRELLIKEGQLFNSALVNRSRERIINLGYFKEVNLQMRPGSDDEKMNLIIDVTEQLTGTLSMGGGYGTVSKLSIFTEIGENNLGGVGQKVSGKLEYGPNRISISSSWTDPWIYEACEINTGNFWRTKQKEFDEAPDLTTIADIAGSLQNEYESYGQAIREYAQNAGEDDSIEALDGVKVHVRNLLYNLILNEESCHKNIPHPWSLSLSAFYTSSKVSGSTIRVSDDFSDIVENANYEVNRMGLGIGASHRLSINWMHYHRYSPSWSITSKPSGLVTDEVLAEADLGWQFKSSLTNGLVYETRDNVFNSTAGLNVDLSVRFTGQALGGQDHSNQYNLSAKYYLWWFDYTLGGLFRKNTLRRWRVVQEFRFSGVFTHEAAPFGVNQDKEKDPYIDSSDRLFMGGYETLRGYDYFDPLFPAPWRDGASHMILASTELRFPIEPNSLWLTLFVDSGTMFDNIGEYTGTTQENSEGYQQAVDSIKSRTDPVSYYLFDRYRPDAPLRYPYESLIDWNDPRRAVFSQRNLALDRVLFSWGAGLRIQIPVLPFRLFWAQKLYYRDGRLRPIPGDDKFEFVIGIGEFRF